jgi:hypothetical protein
MLPARLLLRLRGSQVKRRRSLQPRQNLLQQTPPRPRSPRRLDKKTHRTGRLLPVRL